MKTYKIFLILILTLTILQKESLAQPDFNVTQLNNPAPGYLIFDWVFAQSFFAVDNYGYNVLKQTPSNGFKTSYFKQLSNGLWAVISGNKFYLYDKKLNLVDSLKPPPQYRLDFHDIIVLKNGNYLLLCTEEKVTDLSNEVEGGFADAILIYNIIVETNSAGTIFWEWKSSEHMDISDATEGVNLKNKVIDLVHINSLFEDEDGNILVSIRHFDEISLIKKSTGNFIWRMGGSKSKRNQFQFVNDDINGFYGFSHQHTASFLPNGNLLLYDNGNLKSPQYSRAVEYAIDDISMTATKVWEYRYSPDVYQHFMGGVERLPNGNTLINWGGGKITEVKPDKTIAFEITYYDGYVYRAYKVSSIANTTTRLINAPGEYIFNSVGNNTGVSVNVSNISSSNETNIQKHNYPPHTGHFNDSTFSQIYPYRWVFSRSNVANISGKFKISKAAVPEIVNPAKTTIYKRDKEAIGEFYALKTTYNSATGEIIGDFQGFGEFVLVSNALDKPILTSPINSSDAGINGKLIWQTVLGAQNYQIQIDTLNNFAKPISNKIILETNSLDYEKLKSNRNYYWRVRALNSKDTSAWSTVYTFKTVNMNTVLSYPNDGAVGITLSDSLVWNVQSDLDTYHVQISKTIDFKQLEINLSTYSKPKFALKDLDFNTKYFWRIKINNNDVEGDWSLVRNFTTTFETPSLVSPSNKRLNVTMPVDFKWSSPVNVDSYTIEIAGTKDFKNLIYSKSDIISNAFVVEDLEYGSDYFWRIRAKKGEIYSDWTQVFEFGTQLKTPNLISPSDKEDEVQLTSNLKWELTELNIQYAIQVSNSADFSILIIDTLLFSQNSLPINSLQLKNTYYWRVKTVNNIRQSTWSDSWKFTVSSTYALNAPKLLYPWSYFNTNIEGILIWNNVDSAQKYRLQVSRDKDFNNSTIDVYVSQDTSYWYSDLEYEQVYFWRVKSLSESDSSNWSNTYRFTCNSKVFKPTLFRPTNDMLQLPISGRLQWYWIPAIESYSIQISENEDFVNLLVDSNNVINSSYDYFDLNHNTQYFWRVRFKRDGEISDWSNVWTFRTVTEDTLSRPIALSPSEFGGIHPPEGAMFVWNTIPDADHYIISISDNRGFDRLIIKSDKLSDTSFVFSGFDYQNFYYWRVSAVNSKTQSAWSSVRSFYTYLEIPEIVYPVDNSVGIPYDGKLAWNYNDTNNYFRIQISKNSEFNEANIVLELDSIRQFSHDYVLEPNQSYFMRIRTYSFFNRSVWSEPISFTTGNTTNVYDILHNYGIAVFPNPASDFVQVLASGIKHYKIVDVLGNILIQKTVEFSDEVRVDLSEIP
ncbi:MAG: hypothetical protein CVV22_12255, partial [Ignavibacteriae bacterium HGW-Ignavibacteriae-1]